MRLGDLADLGPTMSTQQVAELYGVTPDTLYAAVRNGTPPVPVIKIGHAVRWPTAKVLASIGLDAESETSAAVVPLRDTARVTRTVVLDLDDPGAVERVWMEVTRLHAVRQIDPELRQAIVRRCEEFTPSTAAPILKALDELHPEAVLEAHFRTLVPDRPTIGAIRQQKRADGE